MEIMRTQQAASALYVLMGTSSISIVLIILGKVLVHVEVGAVSRVHIST